MSTHVFPIDDWIEHVVDDNPDGTKCPCEPDVEHLSPETGLPYPSPDAPLVIHHALDGRE